MHSNIPDSGSEGAGRPLIQARGLPDQDGHHRRIGQSPGIAHDEPKPVRTCRNRGAARKPPSIPIRESIEPLNETRRRGRLGSFRIPQAFDTPFPHIAVELEGPVDVEAQLPGRVILPRGTIVRDRLHSNGPP